MGAVYPRSKETISSPPFNEPPCVAQIILMREDDPSTTLAEAVGYCLEAAGGTPRDVYHVWDEIEKERLQMQNLPLQDEAEYIESVSSIANHLDPIKWIVGLKAKLKVSVIVAPEPDPESMEL